MFSELLYYLAGYSLLDQGCVPEAEDKQMESIKNVLMQDRFCVETVGIQLLEISEGRARTKLEIGPEHLNGLGIIQGGVIFSLADFALAAAANSYGTAAVLISANISYFKAVSSGTLYAAAVEETRNPKLATYIIRVTNENDELLATVQSTVYRKKERLV